MAEEDYLIFFTGEGERRVERRLKKSQVTAEKLAQMFGVSHNAEALTLGSLKRRKTTGSMSRNSRSARGFYILVHFL